MFTLTSDILEHWTHRIVFFANHWWTGLLANKAVFAVSFGIIAVYSMIISQNVLLLRS